MLNPQKQNNLRSLMFFYCRMAFVICHFPILKTEHNCFFSDFLRDESAHSADSARCGTRLNLALFSRQIWLAVVVDKNAKTWGVQSNLQSHFNYRSKNMRLEMKFFKKSDKSKWLSKFFSANSFYILNWRIYIKNLVRNTFC